MLRRLRDRERLLMLRMMGGRLLLMLMLVLKMLLVLLLLLELLLLLLIKLQELKRILLRRLRHRRRRQLWPSGQTLRQRPRQRLKQVHMRRCRILRVLTPTAHRRLSRIWRSEPSWDAAASRSDGRPLRVGMREGPGPAGVTAASAEGAAAAVGKGEVGREGKGGVVGHAGDVGRRSAEGQLAVWRDRVMSWLRSVGGRRSREVVLRAGGKSWLLLLMRIAVLRLREGREVVCLRVRPRQARRLVVLVVGFRLARSPLIPLLRRLDRLLPLVPQRLRLDARAARSLPRHLRSVVVLLVLVRQRRHLAAETLLRRGNEVAVGVVFWTALLVSGTGVVRVFEEDCVHVAGMESA